MTTPEPYATRREIDMLRSELQRLDDHGSRGVGTLQTQMTEIIKDLTELRNDTTTRFAVHDRQHEKDIAARLSGRRWLAGVAIAAVAGLVGVIALLLQILDHLQMLRH